MFNDNNKVADETIDPSARAISHSLCPSNYRCRYSDAAFAEMDGVSIDRGEIAKPDAVGSTDVDPAYETFDVNRDSGSFVVGDEVNYVGKASGWRTGDVTHTCTDLVYRKPQGSTPGIKVICVGKADVTDGHGAPIHGDSGAPVFIRNSGDDVELIGNMVGKDVGLNFIFSKLGFIYYELDSSANWRSCTSGC